MQKKPERRIVKLKDSLRSASFKFEVLGYCENSSIHGVKYIIEKHRPNFERLIWSIVVGVALVYAGIYTLDILEETPIVTEEGPVHKNYRVPMPGVTVCSNAKVAKSSNWGQERTKNKDLHTLRFLCGEAFPNSRSISVKRLNETAPDLESTCSLDIYRGDGSLIQQQCKSMFQKVISEQGVCYTFNSYLPEHVYRDDVLLGDRVAREFGGGMVQMGPTCGSHPQEQLILSKEPEPGAEDHLKCGNHTLKLSMYSGRDDTGYCTFSNTTGFKVLIHNPKDAPSIGFRRLIWTQVMVKAEARLINHSPNLLWFHPKKRECYGEKERYLRFFRTYTKFNCMLECLTNLTASMCRCVDFYMPHLEGTEVCKRVNLPCIFDVIDLFRKKNYCDCFPACYELTYFIQTRSLNDTGTKEGQWNDTSITVRLDLNVTESIRRPSFTDLKVISNSGGVFGFFLGLSFISVFELVYYLFIRSVGNCYKDCCKGF